MESSASSHDTTLAPDFVIAGAMKCGTTTLHQMLAAHPGVYMPEPELHILDRSNIIQHPDFAFFKNQQWNKHSELGKQASQRYYQHFYQFAKAGQLKGEDSTTYLCSPRAIKQLVELNPSVKLLVVLRHPTKRAYSHYWHMVKTGRVIYRFEDLLVNQPETVLSRSMYSEQLVNILRYIPKEQLKIVLFEDLVKDTQQVLEGVLRFLNLEVASLPEHTYSMHANRTYYPRFTNVQLIKNRLFRKSANISYRHHFANQQEQIGNTFFFERMINKIHQIINPLVAKSAPPISPASERYLNEFFKHELSEIDDITGQPIFDKWFKE